MPPKGHSSSSHSSGSSRSFSGSRSSSGSQIILPAKLAFLQQPLVILISLLRQVFWLFLIRQAEFPFRDQPYRLCSENRNGFTVAARSPAPDQSADRFCYIRHRYAL